MCCFVGDSPPYLFSRFCHAFIKICLIQKKKLHCTLAYGVFITYYFSNKTFPFSFKLSQDTSSAVLSLISSLQWELLGQEGKLNKEPNKAEKGGENHWSLPHGLRMLHPFSFSG